MKAYFIRRLLLIPVTLIGITIVVFLIMYLVPGGPIESSLQRMMGGEGNAKRSRADAGASVSIGDVMTLEEKYNRDKTPVVAYLEWLGLMPRDLIETKEGKELAAGEKSVEFTLPGTTQDVVANVEGSKASLTLKAPDPDAPPTTPVDLSEWHVRVRSSAEQVEHWKKWVKSSEGPKNQPNPRVVIYKSDYDGLFQGSLGNSEKYQEPVVSIMASKLPVSLYFGLITMIVTYGLSVPLGILKAVRHRTWIDNSSSLALAVGYSIPGYALGMILLAYVGVKYNLLPIRGFTGDGFESLSLFGKIRDLTSHTLMPMAAYLVGAFAFPTLLVKNNLMENLSADYVRTAMAKGVSYPTAVFKHAFRNSLIPLASTCGDILLVLVAGSILVEKVFDIDGFGLLQLSSLMERDTPMIMGVVVLSSVLMMLGNVISDLAVAMVDPKVSFK